jgi:hypothetical protein
MVDGRKTFMLHAIAVRGDKTKETVQIGHCSKGSRGLCGGQRTDGGENATVDASTIIKEISNCYLQLLLLGSGGGGGRNR